MLTRNYSFVAELCCCGLLSACAALPPPATDDSQSTDQTSHNGDGANSDTETGSTPADSLTASSPDTGQGPAQASGKRTCFASGLYRVDLDVGVWQLPQGVPPTVQYVDEFCIDNTEVTRGEWRECVKQGSCSESCSSVCDAATANGGDCVVCLVDVSPCPAGKSVACQPDAPARKAHKDDKDLLPMRFIEHGEAAHFCGAMRKTGRLPTLLQWRVALASSKPCYADVSGEGSCSQEWRKFPWGNSWPPPFDHANVGVKLGVDSAVGVADHTKRKPSPAGIYDLIGNVAEHLREFELECSDCPSSTISSLAVGGSHSAMEPKDLRVGRPYFSPYDSATVGFRCVSNK